MKCLPITYPSLADIAVGDGSCSDNVIRFVQNSVIVTDRVLRLLSLFFKQDKLTHRLPLPIGRHHIGQVSELFNILPKPKCSHGRMKLATFNLCQQLRILSERQCNLFKTGCA